MVQGMTWNRSTELPADSAHADAALRVDASPIPAAPWNLPGRFHDTRFLATFPPYLTTGTAVATAEQRVRLAAMLAGREEDGARVPTPRVRRMRWCPHGAVYRVREDA